MRKVTSWRVVATTMEPRYRREVLRLAPKSFHRWLDQLLKSKTRTLFIYLERLEAP